MSTGLDLLHRIRQQQQHVPQAAQQKERQKRPVVAAAADEKVTEIERTSSSKPKTTTTIIEVCLGPDCSGGGGGAALLEIEELVSYRAKSCTGNNSDDANNKNVKVVIGGCRDLCTMGPNVYIKTHATNKHHSKVKNPEICRDIVTSIYEKNDTVSGGTHTTSSHTTTDSVTSLLRRREDSARWQSHKDRAARERRFRVRER